MLEQRIGGEFGQRRFRRTRLPVLAGLLVFGVAIAFVVLGSQRVGMGAAQGESFSEAWPKALMLPRTLRLATYNIDGGQGLDGKVDLRRTSEVMNGYDLVGLEEVHGYLGGPVTNQAQELGELVHEPWLFAPSEMRWFHPSFGNGVVSLVRVDRWMRIPLTGTQHRGIRNMILMQVPIEGATVNVLVTHLDREADRDVQLASVTMLFGSLAEPAVLMGDLNRYPDDPAMRKLADGPGVEDCLAKFPSELNAHRVDWILARGMTAIGGGFDKGKDASDHPLAWAELALPRARRSATTEKH